MDPFATDVLRLVASALVAAVVGGGVAEWRARAAEKRADRRETARLERQRWLEAITDTQRYLDGLLQEIADRLFDGMEPTRPVNLGDYPKLSLRLVADKPLLTELAEWLRWSVGQPGAGIPGERQTRVRFAKLGGALRAALNAQEQRVLEGESPLLPPEDDQFDPRELFG